MPPATRKPFVKATYETISVSGTNIGTGMVGPTVPGLAQLRDEGAFGLPEDVPKNRVPGVPHEFEQRRRVPVGDGLRREQTVVANEPQGLLDGAALVDGVQFPLHEGAEPLPEQVERLADAFMIGDGQGLSPPAVPASRSSVHSPVGPASIHSYAGWTLTPGGASAGKPSRVRVSNHLRAPGCASPASASARNSRAAVVGSDASAQT